MKIFNLSLALISTLSLAACSDDGYSGLKDKADVEAQQNIESVNRNLTERAQRMETDLARRQRYYQSVAGQYQGQFLVEGKTSHIRFTLTPTVYPLDSQRTRLPEEIAVDLSNLAFDVHVIQWSAQYSDSSWGCRAEDVRADLGSGKMNILVQEECSFTYALALSDPSLEENGSWDSHFSIEQKVKSVFKTHSRLITQDLLDDKRHEVNEIMGVIRPSLRPVEFFFKATRVSE